MFFKALGLRAAKDYTSPCLYSTSKNTRRGRSSNTSSIKKHSLPPSPYSPVALESELTLCVLGASAGWPADMLRPLGTHQEHMGSRFYPTEQKCLPFCSDPSWSPGSPMKLVRNHLLDESPTQRHHQSTLTIGMLDAPM